jgi:hypothetical protein
MPHGTCFLLEKGTVSRHMDEGVFCLLDPLYKSVYRQVVNFLATFLKIKSINKPSYFVRLRILIEYKESKINATLSKPRHLQKRFYIEMFSIVYMTGYK